MNGKGDVHSDRSTSEGTEDLDLCSGVSWGRNGQNVDPDLCRAGQTFKRCSLDGKDS